MTADEYRAAYAARCEREATWTQEGIDEVLAIAMPLADRHADRLLALRTVRVQAEMARDGRLTGETVRMGALLVLTWEMAHVMEVPRPRETLRTHSEVLAAWTDWASR